MTRAEIGVDAFKYLLLVPLGHKVIHTISFQAAAKFSALP